jgi:hypothetical protein
LRHWWLLAGAVLLSKLYGICVAFKFFCEKSLASKGDIATKQCSLDGARHVLRLTICGDDGAIANVQLQAGRNNTGHRNRMFSSPTH